MQTENEKLKNASQRMFLLIRYAIKKEDLPELQNLSWEESDLKNLFALSKHHDMAHLVGSALEELHLLGENEISEAFRKETFTAVFRYQRIQYEYEDLCKTLEENGIDYLPLKGSIIRAWYPEPWMRTSCDIDILVRKKDLERTLDLFCKTKQYEIFTKTKYDVSLYSPSNVHVEFHFSVLTDKDRQVDALLARAWDFATREGESHRYAFSEDFFLFHFLTHMSLHHFLDGGCGVRPFLDLWIFQTHLTVTKETKELLKKGKMLAFYESSKRLSEVWFDGAGQDALSEQMENFLLYGGIYGTDSTKTAIGQARRGGKLSYFLSRLFMPYRDIVFKYPILRKRRWIWLLPFCEVLRWFEALSKKSRKRIFQEAKQTVGMTQTEKGTYEEMLKELGLK